MSKSAASRDHILDVFLQEIQRECIFVEMSAELVEAAVIERNIPKVMFGLHAFVAASANISKILWPGSKAEESRGNPLRALLEIEDGSPIRSKALRNHLEHYDERLDQWAAQSADGIILDDLLFIGGGKREAVIVGFEASAQPRTFSYPAWVYSFRGTEFPLKPVLDEVRNLRSRVAARNDAGAAWKPNSSEPSGGGEARDT